MVTVTEIEEEVFKSLRSLRPLGTIIKRDQRLIVDLNLQSDDATAMTIDLKRKFRIRISNEEWGTVLTVQDVIDLLARHLLPPHDLNDR